MKQEMVRRLREYGVQRQAVEIMDVALQVLTPEERLVAERLLIHPQRGAVQQLCQILNLEQASIYRRRDRVLEKLAQTMHGQVTGES